MVICFRVIESSLELLKNRQHRFLAPFPSLVLLPMPAWPILRPSVRFSVWGSPSTTPGAHSEIWGSGILRGIIVQIGEEDATLPFMQLTWLRVQHATFRSKIFCSRRRADERRRRQWKSPPPSLSLLLNGLRTNQPPAQCFCCFCQQRRVCVCALSQGIQCTHFPSFPFSLHCRLSIVVPARETTFV